MGRDTLFCCPDAQIPRSVCVIFGNHLRRLAFATLAVMAALAPPAAAQTLQQLQGMSIEDLGNVQVTSVAKASEPLGDAPAAIYVISHDDIIRSGATTIPEMLRLAPNLEVAQLNSTSYAISARGFNVGDNASLSNKLLVLIDGRSVYSGMFGGVYWDMIQVLPENIERIEVISGPGATLWGANAVNGVINIITRNSSQTQGGVLTLSEGNYQRGASVQYGGRLAPDLTYRVHLSIADFSAYPTSSGQSANDGWYKPQGGFRVDWNPPNDSLSVQGDLFTATEQPDGFIRGHDVETTWQHKFNDGSSLQLLAYYDRDPAQFHVGRLEQHCLGRRRAGLQLPLREHLSGPGAGQPDPEPGERVRAGHDLALGRPQSDTWVEDRGRALCRRAAHAEHPRRVEGDRLGLALGRGVARRPRAHPGR